MKLRYAVLIAVLACATSAKANLITDLTGVPAGATLQDFNSFTTPTTSVTSSLVISPDVTLKNNSSSISVGEQFSVLGNNGDWNAAKTGYVYMDGHNGVGAPHSMTFQFAHSVNTVAVFMSYGFINADVSLIAHGTGNSILEQYNLIFSPSGQINIDIPNEGFLNQGRIRGISRTNADITSFEIRGDFVGVDDLRYFGTVTAAAPEPGTLTLLAIVSLPVAGIIRRRIIR